MKNTENKKFLQALSDHFSQGTLTTVAAINLSQAFPSWVGYSIARAIALVIASRSYTPLVKAIRCNQWVAHDRKISHRDLNRAVRQVLTIQSRSLYSFYHYLDRPERISDLVSITPRMQAMIDSCNQGGRGTFMLLPHLSGFDLGGLQLAKQGFKYLTLSYPNPPKGYEMQNKIRNDRGEEVMPMSFETIRLARERLQAGGTVMTGLDRPLPGSGYFPKFFGMPAELPVAYMKLILKTNARVFVIGVLNHPDGTYSVDASDEIPIQPESDARVELEENCGRVLIAAENFIRQNPAAWAMFYPVWPELLDEMPG